MSATNVPARAWRAPIAAGLAVGVAIVTTSTVSAVQVDGNTPLDPCLGDECPGSYIPPNNGSYVGFDDGVSVFAGGDFSIGPGAAEAEGNVVVLGDATFDKGQGIYNLGSAGVGSRVPPPANATMLTVGGNLTVGAGTDLAIGQPDLPSNVDLAGTEPANATITQVDNAEGTSSITENVDVASVWNERRANVTALSQCLAEQPVTGTVEEDEGGTVTFTGTGAAIEVFEVTAESVIADWGAVLAAENLAGTETVIINVTSSNAVDFQLNGTTGGVNQAEIEASQRIVFNFPNSTDITMGGSVIPGSVLVGQEASTTNVNANQFNGRIEVAGNLQHGVTTSNSGLEFHAYPFIGPLPDCGTTPTPTTSPTTSPSPSVSPTVSPSPSVSPSTSVTPSPSESPTDSPSTSPSPSGSTLPATGAENEDNALMVLIAGLLFAVGLSAIMVARRR